MLHRIQRDEGRLISTRLADGVSTHAIGSRELDKSAWIGQRFVMSRRSLHSFDLVRGVELPPLGLPGALRALSVDAARRSIAAALDGGSVRLLVPRD